jgi:RHS repeat-associated protein
MATGFLLSGPNMLDRPLTPKGQVKKKTKTIDSIQYVTQYSYDMNGNLKTITEPSGEVITNNYSNDKAVSVLKGAANLAAGINYKPFGGVSSLSYGNGIAGSISYDNQYRVTGIIAGAAMSLSYPTYDANGNITAINNVLDATKNKSFSYDTLDRLSTATASGLWGSLSWTYDGVGNRQTEGSTSYTYQPNTNKLNTVGGTSYGFDSNGNTTSQGARQYTYNQNQRLAQVVDGAMTATYTYDGNGQRVKKVVNGVTTIFHYDERGQLIAESNGSGAITAVYVYLNGQPLAKIEGTSVYYYHNDALGTPQTMTDATGTVVWAADYKPFGEATITVSTITNNLRFPGQYFDAETGLLYNYMRDYDPVIGKYKESDPIGIQQGTNHLFAYAANNPIRFDDPNGLCHSTLDISGGNVYTMYNPGPANNYASQTLVRENRVGRLVRSSGTCNCENKVLDCSYDIYESRHWERRSYNRRTRQYGSWSTWDPDPTMPGYDDRLVGHVTVQYNCKDDSITYSPASFR